MNDGQQNDWQKEGIQTVIDYTKFVMTLASGAIAFVIQPTFSEGTHFFKVMAIFALFSLAISVAGGIMVYSAGSMMLARKDYNLENPQVRYASITSVLSFVFGILLIGIAVAMKIIKQS